MTHICLYANNGCMDKIRTTLRIEKQLKTAAERRALELDTTLQDIFNTALRNYLTKANEIKVKDILFYDRPISAKLNDLKREDYYV